MVKRASTPEEQYRIQESLLQRRWGVYGDVVQARVEAKQVALRKKAEKHESMMFWVKMLKRTLLIFGGYAVWAWLAVPGFLAAFFALKHLLFVYGIIVF